MVHSLRLQSAGNQEPVQFFAPDAGRDSLALATKTLVVPIVSAANVPQLAVDILIVSLCLSRVGTFDSRYFVPVVGGIENADDGVTTPAELFGKEGIDFVFIQQRSPVLKARKDKFISSLKQFARECGFKSILFLSGLDLSNRTDAQMSSPIYRLTPAASPALDGSPLAQLKTFPQYEFVSSQRPSFSSGGLTKRIFLSITDHWTIPTGFLLIFAMEGDNRADAAFLSKAVAQVLLEDGTIIEWKEPESWRQGLLGPAHDQTLFG